MERYKEQAQFLANYLPNGKFWTAKNYTNETNEEIQVFSNKDFDLFGSPKIDENGIMTYQSNIDNIVLTNYSFDNINQFSLKFSFIWNGNSGYISNIDAETFYSIYIEENKIDLSFFKAIYEEEIKSAEEICKTSITLNKSIKTKDKIYINIEFNQGNTSLTVTTPNETQTETRLDEFTFFEPYNPYIHIGYNNISKLDIKDISFTVESESYFDCFETISKTVIEESNLRKLLNSFGKEFVNIEDRNYWLKKETNIKTTYDLLEYWENLYGIPDADGIFVIENKSIEERRNNIILKEFMNGADTSSDWEYIAKQFGYNVKVLPCTETDLEPPTDKRYNIVVTFLDFKPTEEFTLFFPINFYDKDVSLLKKIFNIIKPATCDIIYR